jgi:hypothetical protein
MFNSCNTLIAQSRLIGFGFIFFVIHVLHFQIFGSIWQADHVTSRAEFGSIQIVTCCGFKLVDFSMFVPSPWNPIRLNSCIRQFLYG